VSNSTPSDPLIGTTLSQYEIVAKLGGGGMGVVYKARDLKLGRLVALKFLPPQWSHDEHAKQRFIREAQAASATHHKNICTIHNIEETTDGRLFIVMAYYEGETLKQRLERGPLGVGEVIEYGAQIAEGLAKAHAQGVVHRDVKPGNIILSDDEVKLLDFGLAKFADALQLTVPGSTIGTVAYMSPEQVRGEEADARSDLWALGIVLYEMLTGTVPFHGAYPEATFHAIKNEPIPALASIRADVPETVVRVVTRALQKDPAQRFAAARDLARELRTIQGRTMPLELRTEPVPAADVQRRTPKRRPLLTTARLAVLAMALGVIATGGYYWSHRPVSRIRVAVVPVANHTGVTDLDEYRLALTGTLVDELTGSPNIEVVAYGRLLEIVRPFVTDGGDVSSSDVIHAIATRSGAPFIVVPTLVYRDRDAMWLVQIQVRSAETGTTVHTYETPPVSSSLSRQTAYRLVMTAADSVQAYFKEHGPGRSFVQRASSSRLAGPEAARAFEDGIGAYAALEYKAAAEKFREAAALDSQHALTQAWLSRALWMMSDKNESVAAGRRARTLLTAQAAPAEVTFVDAMVQESTGDLDAAEASYRALLDLEPASTAVMTELADFLKRRQDRNSAAVETYHAILAADPDFLRPHVELCQLYTRLDDYPRAEQEGQLARDRARTVGNRAIEAHALLCLADLERNSRRNYDQARRDTAQARSLFEALGQQYNDARAAFYQALVEYSSARFDEAGRLFEDAAALLANSGNRVMAATALMNVGVVNFYTGHPTQALTFWDRSSEAFRQLGDERRAAEVDVNASSVRIDFGIDIEQARRAVDNAKQNLERLGHVDFQLGAMQTEADDYRYRALFERGRVLLASALAIARDKGLVRRVTTLTIALGQNDTQAGRYAAAYEELRPLVAGNAVDPEARVAFASVLTAIGSFAEADEQLRLAAQDIEQSGRAALRPAAEAAVGRLRMEQGQLQEATTHLNAAIDAWNDPLPNAFVVEARCSKALIEGQQPSGRIGALGRLRMAVADADRIGRVVSAAECRLAMARVQLKGRDTDGALAMLAKIPEDTAAVSLGQELRARIEYWRGRALEAGGRPGASACFDRARNLADRIASELPPDRRAAFEQRSDIRPMLLPASQVS
jgi:tetratricopeptide (TPR) repeat protein